VDQSFRLNNNQYVLPVEKLGEGYQSESACRIGSTWFLASLLVHGKLLPEEEIFSNQLASAACEEKKK
jgi:hypothetical protein